MTFPDDALIGATPHRCAHAASERSRSGLSPAATISAAAPSTPTPCKAGRLGAALGDEGLEQLVDLFGLFVEGDHTPRQRADGELGGGSDDVVAGTGPHGRGLTRQHDRREPLEAFTQLIGAGEGQVADLAEGLHTHRP